MHVFEYENCGLLLCTGLQQSEDSAECLVLQLLGREFSLGVAIPGRNRQQRGQEGNDRFGLLCCPAYQILQPIQFNRRCGIASYAGGVLQVTNDWM